MKRPTQSAQRETREKERRAAVWLARNTAKLIRSNNRNNDRLLGRLIGSFDDPAEFLHMVADELKGKLKKNRRDGWYDDQAIRAACDRVQMNELTPKLDTYLDAVMPLFVDKPKVKARRRWLIRWLDRNGYQYRTGKPGRPRNK